MAPDGLQPIVPKDYGQGLMISAFQSREFGFGLEMSVEDQKRINESRRGKHYLDEKAAKAKRVTREKRTYFQNPFVAEFEYGANYEGYWCYEHMVLQLEDCVDCLKVISSPFEFLFMFDHSCGHDHQREDGLNVENMSINFGGKQTFMHDTLIKQKGGYLGLYPPEYLTQEMCGI